MNRYKNRTNRKQGAVLVLFALIVVGLFAAMALMIDLGLANLTQTQMQTASDATALEILRDRDHTGLNATNSGEAFVRDRRRRQFNTPFADAPFVPALGTEAATGEQHGGGAWIDITPGPGGLQAGTRLVASGVSAPGLQVNYNFSDEVGSEEPLNRRNGDVVSGTWVGDGVAGIAGNPRWMEHGNYERLDFTPSDPTDAPFASAVLVRLRRTRTNFDPSALALDNELMVASSGRTIPLLFGRGTSIAGSSSPTEEFSIRHRGIAVRATTITDSSPAVRIGKAQPGASNGWGLGLVPVALFEGIFLSTNPLWWSQDGQGNDYLDLTRDQFGRYVFGESGEWETGLLIRDRATVVGENLDATATSTAAWAGPSYWARGEGYAPVFIKLNLSPPLHLVVGFLRVSVDVATDAGGAPIVDPNTGEPLMRVTKLRNTVSPGQPWIASRNASTSYGGLQPVFEDPYVELLWTRVLNELNTLEGAIHAPSIAR